MRKNKKEDSFERLIRETPDTIKLDFLIKSLEKQPSLRNQFIRYCGDFSKDKNAKGAMLPEEIIVETSIRLKSQLESLDLEQMDWREYIPRHSGYIEDYEAWEDFADDHLTEIFEGWKNQISTEVRQGELLHGICLAMGCYDACFDVYIPGADDVFEDITSELLTHHQELLNAVVDTLEEVTGSEKEVNATVVAILDYYQGIREDHPDFLRYMEPVLLMITETAGTARFISEAIELRDFDESLVPQLALKIASFDPDPLIWREKAEEYMELDLEVARQLLDHYWTEDPDCFRLVGNKLFKEHPHELCDFLSELLFPMFDKEFYTEVLRFRTLRDRNMDLYTVLRQYLSDEEKQRFIDEIEWDEAFRIDVLAAENRYQELLILAEKKVFTTRHFTRMIAPILNIYPAGVMALIRKKAEHIILHEKGRNNYQRICRWLELALNGKDTEEAARSLIQDLYNRRPALPALREEMRKAGVVDD
ncbi:MAG: hypothetical protein JXA23_10145 [Bacteroidales bacterium]|nr:hypothetical protein [Bacteroidales bacterium]